MKHYLVALLLLAACLPAFADDSGPAKLAEDKPTSTGALPFEQVEPGQPSFSEFKTEIPYGPHHHLRHMMSKHKDNRYWDDREVVFNQEIFKCKKFPNYPDRKECYQRISQSENAKTQLKIEAQTGIESSSN